MSLTSDKIEIVLSSNTEITHSTSHTMKDILQPQILKNIGSYI